MPLIYTKPPAGSILRLDHPLSEGLAYAWSLLEGQGGISPNLGYMIGQGDLRNYVDGTGYGGSLDWQSGPSGPGVITTSIRRTDAGVLSALNGASKISLFAVGNLADVNNNIWAVGRLNTSHKFFGLYHSVGSPPWNIYFDTGTTSNFFQASNFSTSRSDFTAAATFDYASGTVRFYGNGTVRQTSFALTGASVPSDATSFTLGYPGLACDPVYCVYIWINRLIDDADIQSLHNDPFQLYTPYVTFPKFTLLNLGTTPLRTEQGSLFLLESSAYLLTEDSISGLRFTSPGSAANTGSSSNELDVPSSSLPITTTIGGWLPLTSCPQSGQATTGALGTEFSEIDVLFAGIETDGIVGVFSSHESSFAASGADSSPSELSVGIQLPFAALSTISDVGSFISAGDVLIAVSASGVSGSSLSEAVVTLPSPESDATFGMLLPPGWMIENLGGQLATSNAGSIQPIFAYQFGGFFVDAESGTFSPPPPPGQGEYTLVTVPIVGRQVTATTAGMSLASGVSLNIGAPESDSLVSPSGQHSANLFGRSSISTPGNIILSQTYGALLASVDGTTANIGQTVELAAVLESSRLVSGASGKSKLTSFVQIAGRSINAGIGLTGVEHRDRLAGFIIQCHTAVASASQSLGYAAFSIGGVQGSIGIDRHGNLRSFSIQCNTAVTSAGPSPVGATFEINATLSSIGFNLTVIGRSPLSSVIPGKVRVEITRSLTGLSSTWIAGGLLISPVIRLHAVDSIESLPAWNASRSRSLTSCLALAVANQIIGRTTVGESSVTATGNTATSPINSAKSGHGLIVANLAGTIRNTVLIACQSVTTDITLATISSGSSPRNQAISLGLFTGIVNPRISVPILGVASSLIPGTTSIGPGIRSPLSGPDRCGNVVASINQPISGPLGNAASLLPGVGIGTHGSLSGGNVGHGLSEVSLSLGSAWSFSLV